MEDPADWCLLTAYVLLPCWHSGSQGRKQKDKKGINGVPAQGRGAKRMSAPTASFFKCYYINYILIYYYINYILINIYIYIYVYIYICKNVPQHTCGVQKTACRSWFSFSTMCIPGMELRVTGLAASNFFYLITSSPISL